MSGKAVSNGYRSSREPGDLPFTQKRLPGGVLRPVDEIERAALPGKRAVFEMRTPKSLKARKAKTVWISQLHPHA